jgi:hypothetical protein
MLRAPRGRAGSGHGHLVCQLLHALLLVQADHGLDVVLDLAIKGLVVGKMWWLRVTRV